MTTYREFLEAKRPVAPILGTPIEPGAIHPILKDFQRAIVRWAVQGGRRAIFAKFGLGKGMMQQEVVQLQQPVKMKWCVDCHRSNKASITCNICHELGQ